MYKFGVVDEDQQPYVTMVEFTYVTKEKSYEIQFLNLFLKTYLKVEW